MNRARLTSAVLFLSFIWEWKTDSRGRWIPLWWRPSWVR